MNGTVQLRVTLSILFICAGTVFAQPTPENPVPVSTHAEKTGPNTMTFYSYPKYYANAAGALVPVRTAFVESKRDGWDYEVSTGIWTLLVRKDGTFCAEHAEESFTYRLRDMGVAQPSGHTALDWGEADWSNLLVMGDTARWDNVYPGVSVTVRYIHDIMKVDLLLSTEARARLDKEQSVLDAASDGRLAFRFALSNLQTRPSEVRDSESGRSLSETFDIDGPLEFVKNGQVLHSLRPAVAWVLDENGEIPREAEPLELTRRWDGSGMAKGEGTAFVEIGLSLEDLLNAPPGPIAVDPSMTFTGSSDVVDTLLDGATNNGTDESIYWYDGDNIAIGFDVSALGTDKGIISANLSVYEWYSNLSAGVTSRAYWLTEAWEELNATWTVRTSSQNWTTAGGTYTTTNQSAQITLPDDDDEWVTWDVTDAFRAQYPANYDVIDTQGFLLTRSSDPTNKLKIRTSESTETSYRPKLVVSYTTPTMGLYRNSGCTDTYDDWTASGDALRSPKYILAEDDNIYIKVTSASGLGNSHYTVQVTSESDSTGVTIDLAESPAGVYKNSGNELLRLAGATDEGASYDTIKIVNEEVLTFSLRAQSVAIDSETVMADRGQYASGGLWGLAGLDVDKFRDEAEAIDWTSAGYDDAWAADCGIVDTTAYHYVRAFVRDCGLDLATQGEADIFYWKTHGNTSGELCDASFRAVMDGRDISDSTDWNQDLEWVWALSCSLINEVTGDGLIRWDDALDGRSRPAHMILGYHDIMWGAQSIEDDFFSYLNSNNYTVVNSYVNAHEDEYTDKYYYAIVEHKDNDGDKLTYRTADTISTSMRYYWNEPHLDPAVWDYDDYTLSAEGDSLDIRAELPVDGSQELPTIKVKRRTQRKSLSGYDHSRRAYGLDTFTQPMSHETIREQEPETAQQLADVAITELFGPLPDDAEAAPESLLNACDYTQGEPIPLEDGTTFGRTIQYHHSYQGVRIMGDLLSAMVVDDRVVKLRSCWHEVIGEESAKKKRVKPSREAVFTAARNLKSRKPSRSGKRIAVNRAELVYYGYHNTDKQTKVLIPSWRFTLEQDGINHEEYVDAITNKSIAHEQHIKKARRRVR